MEKQYTFGDYVLSGIGNAFNDKTSWWLSKKGVTTAVYCFSTTGDGEHAQEELDYQLKAIDSYITLFETRVSGLTPIRLKHDWKMYELSESVIEAAYRYQLNKYRLCDAKRQLMVLVFGDDDVNLESDYAKDEMKYFEEQYGLTFGESMGLLGDFVSAFEDALDCGLSENKQWENAITKVLAENR